MTTLKHKTKLRNIFIFPFLLLIFGFIQITFLSVTYVINHNNFSFTQTPSSSTIDDLYFGIGPTGEPQYGQNVNWNVPTGTNEEARFYHVKKGDFGLAAIQQTNQYISYSGLETYSPLSNPDVDMTNHWVKIETAWNFAPNTYNIVVVAFTNHGQTIIEDGTIEVSTPFSANLTFQEAKIYNDWVNSSFSQTNNYSTLSKQYTFNYEDLMPGEIRYIYLYLSLGVKELEDKRMVSLFDINANMAGYGSDVVTNSVNPIPHDPNAMYLMNTYFQGSFTQCNDLIDYPDMYEECLNNNISWFGMEDTPCNTDEYQSIKEPTWDMHYDFEPKYCHIIEYPYCHINTEDLHYRVSCFNDGEGIAKDVYIKSIFENPAWEPFDPSAYQLTQTINYPLSNAGEAYSYPEFKFSLVDINLPGLADQDIVRMYSECSTSLNYETATLCDINEAILAHSSIIFTDLNNNAQTPIHTNQVIAVPFEPYNDWDYCSSCEEDQQNAFKQNNTISQIEIYNMNGIRVKSGSFDNIDEANIQYLINTNLKTGVYVLRITHGNESKTIKYFHCGM